MQTRAPSARVADVPIAVNTAAKSSGPVAWPRRTAATHAARTTPRWDDGRARAAVTSCSDGTVVPSAAPYTSRREEHSEHRRRQAHTEHRDAEQCSSQHQERPQSESGTQPGEIECDEGRTDRGHRQQGSTGSRPESELLLEVHWQRGQEESEDHHEDQESGGDRGCHGGGAQYPACRAQLFRQVQVRVRGTDVIEEDPGGCGGEHRQGRRRQGKRHPPIAANVPDSSGSSARPAVRTAALRPT